MSRPSHQRANMSLPSPFIYCRNHNAMVQPYQAVGNRALTKGMHFTMRARRIY